MNSTMQQTPRGPIFRLSDAANTTAFIPSDLAAAEETSKQAEMLGTVMEAFHKRVTSNAATFRDEALPTENSRSFDSFRIALRTSVADFHGAARAFDVADAMANEPAPLKDGAWESRYVADLKALAVPQRIAAVQDLSFVQSSALIRYGDLDRLGLPVEVIVTVRNRHMITGHIARSGMSANYPVRPDHANPLATGVDNAAVMAAATAVLNRHTQRGERVALAADAVRSTLGYIAAATGKTPAVVWAELMA